MYAITRYRRDVCDAIRSADKKRHHIHSKITCFDRVNWPAATSLFNDEAHTGLGRKEQSYSSEKHMMHSRALWRNDLDGFNSSQTNDRRKSKQIFFSSRSKWMRVRNENKSQKLPRASERWLTSTKRNLSSNSWDLVEHERRYSLEMEASSTETEQLSLELQNNPSHLKRASTDKLREIFNRYASKEINGEKYMTSEDFVRKYLGLFPDEEFNEVRIFLCLSRAKTTHCVTNCRNPYFFSAALPTPTKTVRSRSRSFRLLKVSCVSQMHCTKLHFNSSIRMEMEMFHFVSLHSTVE